MHTVVDDRSVIADVGAPVAALRDAAAQECELLVQLVGAMSLT